MICVPYTRVEENAITCITSAGSEENGSASVAIDNWEGTLRGAYEYSPNPEVYSISPQFSFAEYVTCVFTICRVVCDKRSTPCNEDTLITSFYNMYTS